MGKKETQISDAEWQVMEVLWAKAPRSAQEVVDALAKNADWSPVTIKTLLHRLVKKGAIRFTEEGNRYFYAPIAKRERCVQQASAGLIDRLFHGKPAPFLMHIASNAKLSQEEIQQLKQILEEKERKQ